MTVEPQQRLVLGRRIQRAIEQRIPKGVSIIVTFREQIIGLIEDAEEAGAFWTPGKPTKLRAAAPSRAGG